MWFTWQWIGTHFGLLVPIIFFFSYAYDIQTQIYNIDNVELYYYLFCFFFNYWCLCVCVSRHRTDNIRLLICGTNVLQKARGRKREGEGNDNWTIWLEKKKDITFFVWPRPHTTSYNWPTQWNLLLPSIFVESKFKVK